MKINSVNLTAGLKFKETRINNFKPNSNLLFDSITFKGLLANDKKSNIKMCVYDLDDTLLEGSQKTRDKVIKFSKDKNRTLVYASARPIKKGLPLINEGVLAMPDYYIKSTARLI